MKRNALAALAVAAAISLTLAVGGPGPGAGAFVDDRAGLLGGRTVTDAQQENELEGLREEFPRATVLIRAASPSSALRPATGGPRPIS